MSFSLVIANAVINSSSLSKVNPSDNKPSRAIPLNFDLASASSLAASREANGNSCLLVSGSAKLFFLIIFIASSSLTRLPPYIVGML